MKIAYCFHGHLRTGRKNLSLVEHLIGPNPGDVFIHTFAIRDASHSEPLWHQDRAGADEPLSGDDVGWIRETYNPKRLILDATSARSHMPAGCEKMAGGYSLEQSHLLRSESKKKYDVVFCARFDLMLFEPFEFPEDFDKNTYYSGHNLNMHEKGLDDAVFFFGSPNVIGKMSSPMVHDVEMPTATTCEYQGESLFTERRKRFGFDYESLKIRYDLLRSFGPLGIRTGQ